MFLFLKSVRQKTVYCFLRFFTGQGKNEEELVIIIIWSKNGGFHLDQNATIVILEIEKYN